MNNITYTIPYETWNKKLFEYFFNENNDGKIVYLYVTDDLIADLGKEYGLSFNSSIESFCDAVTKYERGNIDTVFRKAEIWGSKWFNQGRKGIPPFLGILSLCVLAASRMNQSDGVTAGNYHYRLCELLGGQEECQRQPIKHFKYTETLWQYLDQWLKEKKKKIGYINAFQFGQQRYVAYPRSQCIVRESDRKDLYSFFQWAGYSAFDLKIEKEDLRQRLLIYFQSKNSQLARYFKEAQEQEGLINAILNIVQMELGSWDGKEIIDPPAKISNKLRKETYINLWFQKGKEHGETQAYLDWYTNIESNEEAFFKSISPFERIGNYLIKSITNINELKREVKYELGKEKRISLYHKPKEIYVFEKGCYENIKGWIQSKEFILNQQYLLLFHIDKRNLVNEWLNINELHYDEFCIKSIKENGWQLLLVELGDVKPVNTDLIDEKLSIKENYKVFQFEGGLKIRRNEWLLEALPILNIFAKNNSVVSINGDESFCVFELKSYSYRLIKPSIQVDLKNLNLRRDGNYTFSVNGVSQTVLLKNNYPNHINFDNFSPEKHDLNVKEINIAGTYIYDNDNYIKKSSDPFIQKDEGEAEVAYRKGQYNNIRFNPSVNAPPFARIKELIPIKFVNFEIQTLNRPIEVLLEYLTIKKEGNWNEFLNVIQYLFRNEIKKGKERNLIAFTIRRNLARLGMVEFIKIPFTTNFSWKVNPTSVAVIPSKTVLMVITGGRTRQSISEIKEGLSEKISLICSIPSDIYEPVSIYYESQTVEDAQEYLKSHNISYNWGEDYFAYHLLRILPTLNELVFSIKPINSTSIPLAEEKEYWDPKKHKWSNNIGTLQRVHFNQYSRTSYLIDQKSCMARPVDKEVGKIFAAQRSHSSIFLYRPYQFFVRREYHLPDLYERCITSCSGQSPKTDQYYRIYENVPFEIAISLSVKMGFKLIYI